MEKRHEWIDALKGWGMLLIVVGHIWSLSELSAFYIWIFAFHVQIFFFASGLTYQPEAAPLAVLARKRFHSLIVPFLTFALLGYVFYLFGYLGAQALGLHIPQFGYGLIKPLLGAVYGTVGDGWLVNSPVWFLPALFVALLMVKVAHLLSTKIELQYLALLLLFALGSTIEETIRLPWSLTSAMCGALFIQLGWHYQHQKIWTRQSQWMVLLLGALGWILSLFSGINGAVGLAGPTVNNPVWFLLFSIAGLGLSLSLVYALRERSGWLVFIGRHSMGLLVLHMLVIKSVKVTLSFLFGTTIEHMEMDLIWGLIVLGTSALLLWPSLWFIEKHFPRFLGIKTIK